MKSHYKIRNVGTQGVTQPTDQDNDVNYEGPYRYVLATRF
jgi:hypothetical protein